MSGRHTLVFYSLFLFCALLASGCDSPEKKSRTPSRADSSAAWDHSIPGSFSAQTELRIDSLSLDSFFSAYPAFSAYTPDVRKFYEGRAYACAWFDRNGLIEQAYNLANRVRNIRDEGVDGQLPYASELDTLMDATRLQGRNGRPDLKLELMLTSSYFAFAHSAWQGLGDSAALAVDWFLPRKKVSYQVYLDSLLAKQGGDTEEPVYRQYRLLRDFLKRYRTLGNESWPQLALEAGRKSIRPGDETPVVRDIRDRLQLLGDYKGIDTSASAVYDDSLAGAVKQFQRRHGLQVDGVIGAGMLAELNVPPSERITRILVNMERSRWVPVRVSSDYLIVNIPEFRLHAYEHDSLVWSCNVVVGQQMHKTVVFNGDVKYVVFSPYWNVPPSIVRNEVLPGMNRNSNYLARHNMEITGKTGNLPVIRQRPGPSNSLGLVKFLFPNSYNIYLHDSPAKSLFGNASRAYSHGCIRVSEPERLANYLLRHDTTWTAEKIHAAMHAGKEKYVTLKQPVPVFIAYFTAFVDQDGLINFRKDIYGRDGRMEEMMLDQAETRLP